MTTNIAQETTSLAPATQSFHPFSIHLINSERVFLLAVFCEYELLLRKAASVLGYPDLAFRADIVKGLFDQVCAKPGTVRDGELNIGTEDEESEFHIALDGACDLVDTYSSYDYDVACQLRTAILNKLSAAPVGYDDDDCDYDILGEPAEPDASSSVQTVQQALPFSDSAFAEPVEPDPAPELSAGDVPVDPPPAEPPVPIRSPLPPNVIFVPGNQPPLIRNEELGWIVRVLQGSLDADGFATIYDVRCAAEQFRTKYEHEVEELKGEVEKWKGKVELYRGVIGEVDEILGAGVGEHICDAARRIRAESDKLMELVCRDCKAN